MKICSKCKIEKELILFSKDSKKKDGLQIWCKECVKDYLRRNKEVIAKQRSEFYFDNKQEIAILRAQYYEKNKEQKAAYNKEYYETHKEELRKYNSIYMQTRRKLDIIFKIIDRRRSRRNKVLKYKYNSTKEDLGCTPEEWRNHLEAKFDENMAWDNYGSYWHADEIIPCTAWDLTNEFEQKACFHYLNSQPLEAKENVRKDGANRKDYTEEKEEFLKKLKHLGII